MAEIRKSIPDTTDREARAPLDRKIIGLAREALGLQLLSRYPVEKTEHGWSNGAEAELLHHLKALSAPQPKKRFGDKKEAANARMERWLSDKKEAEAFIRSAGIDPAKMQRRYQQFLQSEIKTPKTREEHTKRLKEVFRRVKPATTAASN